MNEKVGCPRALVPKRGGRLYSVNDFLTFLPGRTGVLYKRHIFQVVVTNHAFAMLSKEIMVLGRRVHTQLLHVEKSGRISANKFALKKGNNQFKS